MKFSEEQTRAIEAPDGLVVVSSGAGTGKTTVLTGRIRELVRRGADPMSILAVTFTRDAAREMRSRLEDINCGNVRTLHSLSAVILSEAARAGYLPDWTVMSESDCQELLLETMQKLDFDLDDLEDKEKFLRESLQTIERWQENGLALEDTLDASRPDLGPADWLVGVFGAFEAHKRERGLLSYADMSNEARRLMKEHPDLVMRAVGDVRHVLVDEAQDLSLSQADLVAALSSGCGNLFLVGDDDQSLYGFRGSIPHFMERVEEFFPIPAAKGVTRTALTLNRRCTRQILRPAVMVADCTRRAAPKVLEGMRDGEEVAILPFATEKAQLKVIAERIAQGIAAGAKPADYAVLARTRRTLLNVEVAFRKAGVPVDLRSGARFSERSEVGDIMAYMALAVRPACFQSFSRIAARPVRGLGATAVNVIATHAAGRPFYEALAELSAESSAFNTKARTEMRRLGTLLHMIHNGYLSSCQTLTILDAVLKDTGYEKWAIKNKSTASTAAASIHSLRQMAAEMTAFRDFLAELQTMRDTDVPAGQGVYVGTLHASKGREWPHVVIMGMEAGVFPVGDALRGARVKGCPGRWDLTPRTDIDEERRMFHVGLTRAKETCTLTHAMEKRTGQKVRDFMPSTFYYEAGLNPMKTPAPMTLGSRRRREARERSRG